MVIGDKRVNRRKISPSFKEFVAYAQRLEDRGRLELKVISYAQLLAGQAPTIDASKILVMFFFPYQYWNRNIEIYRNGRIYGDSSFGRAFKDFFKRVERAIGKYYRGKSIKYVNPPQASYLDRDKQASKDLLKKNRIPIPRSWKVSSLAGVQRLLNRGLSLYVKPRFGALGKGITYIDSEGVISNFLFRQGRIISRPYDYNWRFTRIKNARDFLAALLKKDFIWEEAITPATRKGKRFDFRIYVMFGKVVYLYVKSAPASSCVTNWSQGGKIDKKKIILKTIEKGKIVQVEKLARKAARALGLNFAGIDVIFSRDLKVAYVLEGNAFPGYEKGFDLMKCLLKMVVR